MRAKWLQGRLTEKDLWVYPMPERIGLTMDVDDGLIVEDVAENSPASRAGIVRGDNLVTLNQQPLVSTADIQWVLHHAPDDGQLSVTLRRNGKLVERTIQVSGGWKKSDIAWRASSWYGLRQGVKLEPLSETEKKQRGIAPDRLALVVKGLYGRGGPHVRQAGLQVNDVVVAVNNRTQVMTETDFLAYLRLQHGPEDSIRLKVLRNGNTHEFTIPLW